MTPPRPPEPTRPRIQAEYWPTITRRWPRARGPSAWNCYGRAARILGVLIEPSAAAGLAAIACHNLPGATLATVLTGTDPDSILLAESPRTH